MRVKWFLSQFSWSCEINVLFHPFLFPEERYGASDLNMRNQELFINAENLFSFNLITYVALVVDSTRVIARSCSMMYSP
jgi:hypothetical protein